MIFGIYGHLKRLYYIYLAVPVNDVQPIWNKICINLQKRMLSPQSTKVLLGYVVVTVQLHIFAVHENVFHELFFVAQSYELFWPYHKPALLPAYKYFFVPSLIAREFQ